MNDTRPEWWRTWLDIAKKIAKDRSVDKKYQVGAIVVTEDNTQVLAIGYNGQHKGGPNCRESDEQGKSGMIHAEVNALIKCDFNHPKKKIMYVTHSCCQDCAKLVINAGIERIIFSEIYRPDIRGIFLLSDFLGQNNVLFHDKELNDLRPCLPYLKT